MTKDEKIILLRNKFKSMEPLLNEKSRRVWAALEALNLEYGGVSIVSKATGISRTTIHTAICELKEESITENARIRDYGGGRKNLSEETPDIIDAIKNILEETTAGCPEKPLLWTCKSTTKIANELKNQNFKVSQSTIYRILEKLGYSLQGNKKVKEASANHPDRDKQFQYISKLVLKYQRNGQPVISVDTKKKELIGNYKNAGREWRKKKNPLEVNAHDFEDKDLGKVAPYGIYDINNNKGWVNVGVDSDTAQFAVESIRRWWYNMGIEIYPQAKEILITADCGGSNGYRVRLWKKELFQLALEIGKNIRVCHFPPGTSKWNKIEHRMFCHISQNWRGRPLISKEVVINLISSTITAMGLEIKAVLDENKYTKGLKIEDSEFQNINIKKSRFHGDWNYKIMSIKK
jgi:transposase